MADDQSKGSSGNAAAIVAVFCSCVALIVSAVALGVALRPTHEASPAVAPVKPHDVAVSVKEYSITLDAWPVPAGAATLRVTNNGNATHEVVVLKTELADDALPRAADGKVDVTSPALAPLAQGQNIGAGGTVSIAATLAPGHYVMICNITGHYAAGMHTGFTVA